ncbi:hypothetical protein C8Q79DRAFT_920776 [Trametes meyenii]|nr:hypothetical protein C8Q79DRAFT_920776 [Trametes meyenii]
MISCEDLFKINRQLAKAFSDELATFGGRDVVLAGDFAQLPPAGGNASLYSDAVGAWSNSTKPASQHAAIGKALWHEFTTVVILRQNMRQQGMSHEDIMFRTALQNMRYARCTQADERLILSRVWASTPANGGHLPKGFETVSIITARNAYRDGINATRATEFARSRGKELHRFHSVDRWATSKDVGSLRHAQRIYDRTIDPARTSNNLTPNLRMALWKIPPALTNHHAGVLELCEGMPVLLKFNEATELCATNGAQAVVDCWDSSTVNGREVLDTLYVRLVDPPRDVQLPGLPVNVIPLTRNAKTVACTLPAGDSVLNIDREQVMVLPNFAMTDYCSQGRTLAFNLCHLVDCRGHQAIYTCLSRSSSLCHTILIGAFDTSKIRCGASSALKREFRELEILDHITSLRESGTLPSCVHGSTRAPLIASFQAWKGKHFVPPHVHASLNWADEDVHNLEPDFRTTAPNPVTGRSCSGGTSRQSSTTTRLSQRGSGKRPRPEQWGTSRAPK